MRELLEFKSYIIEDSFAMLDFWKGSSHFCQWPGITCSLKHQRVTRLNLKDKTLAGSILPRISYLSFLNSVNLSGNRNS